MATFAKKLHMINSAGTEQTAEIYSTADEAGSPYLNATVDGEAGYVALVDISANNATSGRVLHSDAVTYAIGSAAIPNYAYVTFTSSGSSGTFTVPAGVSKLRVTCIGGGAGGVTGTSTLMGKTSYPSTAGRTTTFGTVSAAGASAAIFHVSSYACGGSRDSSDTCYSMDSYTVSKGTVNGIMRRTSSGYSGAGNVSASLLDGTVVMSVGHGGNADSEGGWIFTGGSGYKTIAVIAVTPGEVISYTVASIAPGRRRNTDCYSSCSSDGHNATPGGSGGILVEYGGDIEALTVG